MVIHSRDHFPKRLPDRFMEGYKARQIAPKLINIRKLTNTVRQENFVHAMSQPFDPRGGQPPSPWANAAMQMNPMQPAPMAPPMHMQQPMQMAPVMPMAPQGPMQAPASVDPALGMLRAQYKGSFFSGGWMLYIGAIMVLNAGVLGFNLIKGAFEEQEIEGLETLLAVGGGSLALAVLFFFLSALRWRQTLSLFDNGLHHQTLLGAKTVRYAEIQQVRHEVHVTRGKGGPSVREHIVLELFSGKSVTISDLPNTAQIVPMIPRGNGR